MDVIGLLAEESVKDLLKGPIYASQDKVAKLPQSWQALMQDAESSQLASKRVGVLKRIPLYVEILRVPTYDASKTPQGDSEKGSWKHKIRDAMRMLATAKILHNDAHALLLEAATARSLLDTTIAFLASFSFAVERSCKQAMNKAIAESST